MNVRGSRRSLENVKSSRETYEDLITNCMARYETTLLEARRMTLNELRLYQKAYAKRFIQVEKKLYLQAFLNRSVKATSKGGKKYVFK